jgi:hypothetical protein
MTTTTRPVYAPGTCVAVHLSDAPTFTCRVLDSEDGRFGRVYRVENLSRRGRVEHFDARDIVGPAADPAEVALASDPAPFGTPEYQARIDEIVASDLDAATLGRLTYELRSTSVAVVSLTAEPTPLWGVIASVEEEAREDTATLVADAEGGCEYSRWCLAEPLVAGGWTVAKIRRHLG